MFFTFIRELLFDSKEEMDYSSAKFDSRKVAVFLITVALMLAVVLLTIRLYKQSVAVVQLKDAVVKNQIEAKIQRAEDRKELLALRGYVESLPDKVKKPYPVPSDSGNVAIKPPNYPSNESTPFDEPVVKNNKKLVITKEQREEILNNFLASQEKK